MKISIIAAVSQNGVIGSNGKIPWHYGVDMRWFRDMTMDSTVIMGRKTFQSMNFVPLAGRQNIVLSSSLVFHHNYKGAIACSGGLKEAVKMAVPLGHNVWIIGGAGAYKEALGMAETMYITEIPESIDEGELVYFPPIPSNWTKTKYFCLNNGDDPPPNLYVSKFERISNVVK